MYTVNLIVCLLAVVALVACVSLELMRDLQMFQQNSYRPERYMRWLRSAGESTSLPRLVLLVLVFLTLFLRADWMWCGWPALVAGAFIALKLKRAKYKKPLVMTRRAWRLMLVSTLLEMLLLGACVVAFTDPIMAFLIGLGTSFVISHYLLLSAAWLLRPVEARINRKYYDDAARILKEMPGLKVIGITGSYGKTSTKHYLHRILSEHFDTLMTPGSFNTTMGVIRTVREHMKPYNEVFICEMGAKQPGDIKEICDLVRPTVGIITAVGEQHLESFKTIECVQSTKFELADALPADGLAVVNNDFPYVANRQVDNVETVRYGLTPEAHAKVSAKDITTTADGTTFTVTGCGPDLTLHTRLVGECNISNLLAAVTVARRLGVPDEKIRYAVERIEQVEHRLNVKRTPGGLTIIDDAFNSNPHGSRMALDVLASMTGGRRIVITPGMIELGDRQAELNTELGRNIAKSVDVAIIVGHYNRDAIMTGIYESRPDDPDIHVVDSFAEAQRLLSAMARRGDTVLYENDLPDTFK